MKLPALLLAASSLFAADLSGIWSGQIPNRFGEIDDVSFRFTQTGSSLTGKLYGDNESTPVREGRIDGDQIRFSITTELNGGARTFVYTGKIFGGEIELERKRIFNPGEPPPQNPQKPQVFRLKRVL